VVDGSIPNRGIVSSPHGKLIKWSSVSCVPSKKQNKEMDEDTKKVLAL
jgi:hypothetical protein